MSILGLEVFDRTIQASTIWIDELCEEMLWADRHQAYHALRAVLHALRDRLPVNSAVHFSAQMPMLVRGLFFEGWEPEKVPVKERSQDEFVAHIAEAFALDPDADARQIARCVLLVVARHVSYGEVEKVKKALPTGIRELWP